VSYSDTEIIVITYLHTTIIMSIMQAVVVFKLSTVTQVIDMLSNWPRAEKCTQQYVALPLLTTKH